jgi:hypothetical protein
MSGRLPRGVCTGQGGVGTDPDEPRMAFRPATCGRGRAGAERRNRRLFSMTITIRAEREAGGPSVRFPNAAVGRDAEGARVDRLRVAGKRVVASVAETKREILGPIAFSRVTPRERVGGAAVPGSGAGWSGKSSRRAGRRDSGTPSSRATPTMTPVSGSLRRHGSGSPGSGRFRRNSTMSEPRHRCPFRRSCAPDAARGAR